jgi:superfamily I DNA/RNA helicase
MLAPENDLFAEKILTQNHLGLSNKSVAEILAKSGAKQAGIWQYLQSSPENQQPVSRLKNLINLQYTLKAHELLDHIKNQFFPQNYFVKDEERARLFSKLQKRAEMCGKDLREFLFSVTLMNENDDYDPNGDRITLMTLHASKGLEFPVVFITGCEEGLLPYHSENRETDPDEERRLFYVGMTRAQQRLILTRAKKRVLFGKFQALPPSQFLSDIEEKLKSETYSQRKVTPKSADEKTSQMNLF